MKDLEVCRSVSNRSFFSYGTLYLDSVENMDIIYIVYVEMLEKILIFDLARIIQRK